MLSHFTQKYIDRFWSKVDRGDPDDCWLWTGHIVKRGYGAMAIQVAPYRTVSISAHRIAWMMENDTAIPDGMFVCHRCDNPPCVNPDHLFLGTTTENMHDMMQKGRKASCQWEKNGNAKLTVADVQYIRTHYKPRDPQFGLKPLGRQFGVSRYAIQDVISGRRWQGV